MPTLVRHGRDPQGFPVQPSTFSKARRIGPRINTPDGKSRTRTMRLNVALFKRRHAKITERPSRKYLSEVATVALMFGD
jgi:pSer/pThr/pTyr-binding forkhead associated (FHA) protein